MKKEYYVFKINLIVMNTLAIIIAVIAAAAAYLIDPILVKDCLNLFQNTKMSLLILPWRWHCPAVK